MNDAQIRQITELVQQSFQTFGRGSLPVAGNPIFEATKDRPPMFAMGVDVESVVRFVLAQAKSKK